MQQKIWYGYSPTLNKVCFFDSDPGSNSNSSLNQKYGKLQGTGNFDTTGEVSNLQIESIADIGSRQEHV